MRNALLTGPTQIGKTTICQAVVDLTRQRSYCVRGILTPAIIGPDGQRIGIEAWDLATGARRILARHVQATGSPTAGSASGEKTLASAVANTFLKGVFSGPSVGAYEFDAEALRWGQEVVARAIAAGCDLLIVDEIGRLELERDGGFSQVLSLLETGIVLRSLLVVRHELLGKFRLRLPNLVHAVFEASEHNRDTLPPEMAEWLFLD